MLEFLFMVFLVTGAFVTAVCLAIVASITISFMVLILHRPLGERMLNCFCRSE